MKHVVELGAGRRASYEVIGQGRPALMLPGGFLGAACMRPEATLLADALQCYLIDPHGRGLSTPPSDPSQYSFAGTAAFYEEVRQALGLDGVILVGHSAGASVALTQSALFPDNVVGCVSVGALCVSPPMDPDLGAAWAEAFERLVGRHAGAPWYPEARKAWDTWDERVLAADDAAELTPLMVAVHPLYAAYPDRPDVAAGLASLGEVLDPDLAANKAWVSGLGQVVDLRPLLGKMTCPTLVVAGERDPLGGPVQAQPIADAAPGARFELIPDCGHFPVIEAPQTYRETVIRFLRALG